MKKENKTGSSLFTLLDKKRELTIRLMKALAKKKKLKEEEEKKKKDDEGTAP